MAADSKASVGVRLENLVATYQLVPSAHAKLAALLDALVRSSHAPSAVRDPAKAVDVHVADSLVALDLDVVRNARRIADLGSGAGFPGLVLAAALPAASVHLVESARRKTAVIEELATAAGIENIEVVVERAEAWSQGVGRCDLVTARALASLPVVLEYAAPLLAPHGSAVLWKGRRDAQEEAAAAAAADELGLRLELAHRVRPYPASRHRHLYVARRVRATPARFPRRPGMAAKRPLGAVPRPRAAALNASDRPAR